MQKLGARFFASLGTLDLLPKLHISSSVSLSIRKLAQLQRACALYDFNQKPLLCDLHNVGTALLGREMFGPNHLYTLGKLFVFVL